jgi:hypothetical protein
VGYRFAPHLDSGDGADIATGDEAGTVEFDEAFAG